MRNINRHMLQRACAILAIALWVPLVLAGCGAVGRHETVTEPVWEYWSKDYVPFKPGNRLAEAGPMPRSASRARPRA